MQPCLDRTNDASAFVEILTSAESGQPVGYLLDGASAGPALLVAAQPPIAGRVFDRLLRLPRLPFLRGSLILTVTHADCPFDIVQLRMSERNMAIDETLFLTQAPAQEDADRAVRDGYWTILRTMADLGMIDGRGVPMPVS